MDILDTVDENDNKIGTAAREEIHNSKIWHRGVHVIIKNKNGEIMLQKRSAEKDKSPKLWDILSEHVLSGENYFDCAKRGLFEEYGIKNPGLCFLWKLRNAYSKADYMISEVYELEYNKLPKHYEKDEISSLHFFSISQIKQMFKEKKLTWWFTEIFKQYVGEKSKLKIIKR